MKHEIEVEGPYFDYSSPYGQATLLRDVWYVSRKLDPEECATETQRVTFQRCYAQITRFDNQRRYIVQGEYPYPEFPSLKKAVEYVTNNIVPEKDKNG
jgi:hypothetical protein